jgi:hypothetical protein
VRVLVRAIESTPDDTVVQLQVVGEMPAAITNVALRARSPVHAR